MANICFLQHTYITGSGTDSLMYQWGKRLAAKGNNVSVVCLRTDKHRNDDGILVLNIQIPFGKTRIGSGVFAPILGLHKGKDLRSLLNDYYDVVVTQLYPATLALSCMKERRFKWVHIEWTTPSLFTSWAEFIHYSWASHWNGVACKKADTVLTGSKFNQEWIQKSYGVSSKLMYLDGIDFDLFDIGKYKGTTGPHVLFVGRLVPHKNMEMLISAMHHITKEVPESYLVIVGSQPSKKYMKVLKGMVKRLNLEDNVIFTGTVPWEDLPKYYSESAVFCSPSLWEGFLRAEAAAMGKPMVGFDLTSNIETLKHTGATALKLTPEALGNGILQFLKNPNSSDLVAKQGYNWAKANLDLDVITENLERELLC